MIKVLIAEDNKDLANLLSNILQAKGCSTYITYDGVDAIKYLKGTGKGNVDLVITDIVMPRNDGFDVIEYVKEHTDAKIIAMTGGGTFVTAQHAMDSIRDEVDACLQKPILSDDVWSCITELFPEN